MLLTQNILPEITKRKEKEKNKEKKKKKILTRKITRNNKNNFLLLLLFNRKISWNFIILYWNVNLMQ